jgi:hypothetical protein
MVRLFFLLPHLCDAALLLFLEVALPRKVRGLRVLLRFLLLR